MIQTDEPPPTNSDIILLLQDLKNKADSTRDHRVNKVNHLYIKRWATWLTCDLKELTAFKDGVEQHLPALAAIWNSKAIYLSYGFHCSL